MVSFLQGGTCWWHNCAASRGPFDHSILFKDMQTIRPLEKVKMFGWKRLEWLNRKSIKNLKHVLFSNQNLLLKTESLQPLSGTMCPEDLPPAIISGAFAQMVSWLSTCVTSSYCEAQRFMPRHQNESDRYSTYIMNIYRYHSFSPGPARFLVIIVAFLNQHLRLCSCWWQMLPSFRITQEPHGFATHWCFLQRTRQAVFPTPFGSMESHLWVVQIWPTTGYCEESQGPAMCLEGSCFCVDSQRPHKKTQRIWWLSHDACSLTPAVPRFGGFCLWKWQMPRTQGFWC